MLPDTLLVPLLVDQYNGGATLGLPGGYSPIDVYAFFKKSEDDSYLLLTFCGSADNANLLEFDPIASAPKYTYEQLHDYFYTDQTIGSRCNPANKLSETSYPALSGDITNEVRVQEILDSLSETDVQLLRDHFEQESWSNY